MRSVKFVSINLLDFVRGLSLEKSSGSSAKSATPSSKGQETDVLALVFYAIGLLQKSIGPLTGGVLFFIWLVLGGKWW